MLPVVFEWLVREGWMIFSWWALVTLAGVAAFPLCARLLSGLPDRGYTLARAVGLLLVGWVFWMLGSLGFLPNTTGSILLSWLIVLVVSIALHFGARERFDWRVWWHENRSVVLVGEILFAVLLIGWTVVRAHQNALTNTEKPMDLMFISSIMRSPAFPPLDGWMSGYSISYYYFGYFIAAMLSTMSGITSTVGFNLLISLLFALTGLTAFGVAYNLVRSRALYDPIGTAKKKHDDPAPLDFDIESLPSRIPALLAGLLAMVMVVLMGNFQVALVEIPYQSRAASEAYLQFIGTQEREIYPERQQARDAGIPDDQPVTLNPGKPDPSQWGAWWWFRASRVLNDFNLDGTVAQAAQPIDEFPQFSFLLADNHPHVMALPFVMLSLGLALNLLLTKREPNRAETVFYGLCVGALVFFNTWDVLTGVLAVLGADAVRRLMRGQGRLSTRDWIGMFLFALTLGALALAFYLPFLISFRSQASGILPNVTAPTLLQQYFIMFGPFVLIIAFFLANEAWRADGRMNWKFGLQAALLLLIALVFVFLALMLAAMLVPEINAAVMQFTVPYGGLNGAIPGVLRRRLETLPTTILLLIGGIMIIGRLFPRRSHPSNLASLDGDKFQDDSLSRDERIIVTYPPATGFALVLVGIGVLLSLVPEFFYLRDNFGSRINTIFKFYYQTWLVFSIASAYGVYTILADSRLEKRGPVFQAAFSIVAVIAVGAGMLYPIFGIRERAWIETGRLNDPEPASLTLDGGPTLTAGSDYASIMCWRDQLGDKPAVVAEAVGGPYNPSFGRVAGLTGNPVVLGWENHERQWRGSTYDDAAGTRAEDMRQLYTDLRWDVVVPILQKYRIDYIFYGSSERGTYSSAGEDKFRENLEPVCEQQGSVFYRVTEAALQTAQ
jgi:YYY domain-containing protein